MKEQFPELNKQEAIEAENDFLKMKMMLEKGAHFGKMSECTPEIENEFLKNIMEFERQAENPKLIKVYDKIERPVHFLPSASIPDEHIDKALEELMEWLDNYQISLDVCSPNVSPRELYRFAVEELFEQEMNDISIPGMIHGFIYDEFHPDPIYENTRIAVEDCIYEILDGPRFEWMHHFRTGSLQLNDYFPLSHEEFRLRINNFKKSVTKVESMDVNDVHCMVEGKQSFVKGHFSWKAEMMGEIVNKEGKWLINLEYNEDFGYWYIFSVEIEGIEF